MVGCVIFCQSRHKSNSFSWIDKAFGLVISVLFAVFALKSLLDTFIR